MLTVNKIKSKNVKEFICGAKIEKKILTKQVKVASLELIKQEKRNVINISLKKLQIIALEPTKQVKARKMKR